MQARERILAGAVGVLVVGWLLDTVVIAPGLAWLTAVREEGHARASEVAEAHVLIDRQERIVAGWAARHAAGLLDDEDGARFRVQQALAASARASGFTIESVGGGQRVPAASGQAYDLLRLTVSGEGELAQAQAFIAGLEAAAQPLRIERCELAARDARKDQLDAALTLSTRIVSLAGRSGRVVPAGTKAWQPEPRDSALDALVLAAQPFLADRRAVRQGGPAAHGDGATARSAATTHHGWALVGIVADVAGAAKAFVHNLDDGSERILVDGDHLGADQVVAIGEPGLRLANAGAERLIAVGCDFNGQRLAVTHPLTAAPTAANGHSGSAAAGGGAPASAASPLTPPAAALPDPDRDAILQRLRQQRNRSP